LSGVECGSGLRVPDLVLVPPVVLLFIYHTCSSPESTEFCGNIVAARKKC